MPAPHDTLDNVIVPEPGCGLPHALATFEKYAVIFAVFEGHRETTP